MPRWPFGLHWQAGSGPGGPGSQAVRKITPTSIFDYGRKVTGVPLQPGQAQTVLQNRTFTGPLVGAFLDPGSMQVADFTAALNQWTSYTLTRPQVTRYYMANSTFTFDTNMQEIAAQRIKVCLTLRPAFSPPSAADLASIVTLLQTMQANGMAANITLWHEPFFEGLSIAQFQAMIAYYGPTVRQYYPLFFVTSVQSVQNNSENSYFVPGAFDGCATDFFAFDFINDSFTLTLAATPANTATPPLPFGLWEFASSTDPVVGQSQTQTASFFSYITTYFQGRAAAGQKNADLIWFNAGEFNLLGLGNSQNAGFEGGLGSWSGFGGTAIDTSAQANTGADSAQITATGGANAGVSWPAGGAGVPASPGVLYTFASVFRAATTGRACQTGGNWYNGAAFISSSFPGSTSDVTTRWTQDFHSATSPAGTTNFQLTAQVTGPPGAAEVHWIDDAIFAVQSSDSSVMGFNFGAAQSADFRIPLFNTLVTTFTPLAAGNGSGQVSIGPVGVGSVWYPAQATISTTSGILDSSTFNLYLGPAGVPITLVGTLFPGGAGTIALAIPPMSPGQYLIGVWTGGHAGDLASLNVIGSMDAVAI